MKNKSFQIIFFVILVIAFSLRFYKLGEIPPGVNRDEASLGYTAYSILKTGKDEYSKSYPLSFQSFGDWKLPLYIYLDIPFVFLFGLSDFNVRLPSALAGFLTVILVYYFTWSVFKDKRVALLSMFLLAISPWHLHFSRVASEANLAVLLVLSGMVLFVHATKNNPRYYISSFILLSLSYFTYHGNHIFTTILVAGVLWFYKRDLFPKREAIIGISLYLLIAMLAFFLTFWQADKTKLSGIGIFGDPSVVHAQIELPRNEHGDNFWFSRLIHNKFSFAITKISQNYLKSFSPEFLFIQGGGNRAHNITNFGNFYLTEAPFLLIGLIMLFIKHKQKHLSLLLWWFFASAVAPSLTKDAPHSARMLAILPIPSIITALGIFSFFQACTRLPFLKKFAAALLLIIFLFNFLIYLDAYYIHFRQNEFSNWGIGYKKLALLLENDDFKNKQIIISKSEYSPYIFLLFYQKYSPKLYQQFAERYPPTADEFLHVKKFDKYTFKQIDWGQDINLNNTILAEYTQDIPDNIRDKYPWQSIDYLGYPIISVLISN